MAIWPSKRAVERRQIDWRLFGGFHALIRFTSIFVALLGHSLPAERSNRLVRLERGLTRIDLSFFIHCKKVCVLCLEAGKLVVVFEFESRMQFLKLHFIFDEVRP